MTFDIPSGLLNSHLVALADLSQSNFSSVEQKPSWSTTRTVSTTKTHEFHWDNSTAISITTTYETGVPSVEAGKISIGFTNTYSVGEKDSAANTETDQWTFQLPAIVKPMTSLRALATIQEGKIDVPFEAALRRGSRVWKEKGMYKGTQGYDLNVKYTETPLDPKSKPGFFNFKKK